MKWWEADSSERYWLEVTNRSDIGTDLHDSTQIDGGQANSSWSAAQFANPGDIVFHWRIDVGIVGWSKIVRPASQGKGIWRIELADYTQFPEPIFLVKWQTAEAEVFYTQQKIKDSGFQPPHFLPFSLTAKPGSRWPLRPPMGKYLLKYPFDLIYVDEQLVSVVEAISGS